MLRTVAEHRKRETSLERVVFVLFDSQSREIFEETWKTLAKK
ncbi:MAG: hypothetical protein O7A06_14820 [Acidobacteria bacterium]|nr:hypothetical protein [Acidobacteriota bacterium]